jgi:lipoyl(octanoyl) transferase
MARQWRLIVSPPGSGAYHMAVDEALLESVAGGETEPTLRLYAWEPPCISLGYSQKSADVDFDRLANLGWEAVRRSTGGRAILHTDELTYSLTLPADDPVAVGGIIDCYRRISQALLSGLGRLGAELQADKRPERAAANGPVCFEMPSHYEVTAGGRKLIGSAQARRLGGVLQHGSLPLYGDLGRICDALIYPDEFSREQARQQVRTHAVTLSEALGGQMISWDNAAEAIVAGVEETFEVSFQRQELTDAEQARAAFWLGSRFASAAWTLLR